MSGGVTKEIQAVIHADREIVASWMFKNGFATGHGDTMHDLLSELEWQVNELRQHLACRT